MWAGLDRELTDERIGLAKPFRSSYKRETFENFDISIQIFDDIYIQGCIVTDWIREWSLFTSMYNWRISNLPNSKGVVIYFDEITKNEAMDTSQILHR